METTSVPAMKPVLVERITDDISSLQKSDVEKQKLMFSARAIADIFKCAPIKKTNPSDVGFYDGDLIDLNLVVESGHRTILANEYKNGPEVFIDHCEKDRNWSVNHSPLQVVPTAYLYTYGVLPSGELEWYGNYDGKISIEDDEHKQTIKPRAKSPTIRQILYPNLDNEYFVHRETHSRWDCGSPFCRQGTLQGDGTYKWEDWYLMGKSHNGPEYFTPVVITGHQDVVHPIDVETTYHIYGTVNDFRLPNANLDGYKPGMKIVVCVHPPLNEDDVTACTVNYRDTNADGTVESEDEMTLLLTPHFRRDTKELDASIAVNALITSVTTFEIVDVMEANGAGSYRSWSIEASDEETDFTSGMSQLLGEHIDRGTGDIVLFHREEVKNLKTLKIVRSVTNCGYVLAKFLKSLGDPVFEDATWTATVRAINIDSGATFVKETATTPQEQRVYYIKDPAGKYSLVGNDGRPSEFVPGVTYYYLDLTHSNYIDLIQIGQTGGGYRNTLLVSDLKTGVPRSFSAFINRNDVIVIEITSTNYRIEEYRDKLVPQVFFYPDPHDSYVQKVHVNPKAFTAFQLNNMLARGEMVPMSEKHALDAPASTRALINAYLYLASNLQRKGMLHGNVSCPMHDSYALNRLTEAGFHWAVPMDIDADGNPITPPWDINSPSSSWPPCSEKNVGMHIMCLTGAHSDSNVIHKDEGEIAPSLQVVQIALAPLHPESKIPMLYVRRGWRENAETNVWNWTPWVSFFEDVEWERIVHKPLFFKARWDYFMDPNALIDRIDAVTNGFMEVSGDYVNVGCKITAEEIQALMASSSNPERDENVKFRIPTFMIGRKNLAVRAAWELFKAEHGCKGIDYIIDVELPTATESQLSKDIAKVDNRRKIAFMFYGSPNIGDFHKLILKAHYSNSTNTKSYYYNLTWEGEYESIFQVEFDQIDLPRNEDTTKGDRIWAPLEAL